MSANGQINWDSVAPRANAGATGAINWDSVAPKANPTQSRPDTSGSMALDFMQGGGAELIGMALGAYNLLRKIPGADKILPAVSPEVQQYAEPPHTVAAKLGGIFTQLGEFAVPAGEAAAATKGAGLVARAGAQAAAAGGVEAARTGGNVPATVDAAALGAAGPVVGAGLRAAAPILRAAPSVATDLIGLASPRAAHLARIGGKIAKAIGSSAEEAAPAAKAAAPVVDTEEQQLLDAIQRGQSRDIAAENNPQPKPPRDLSHYGVKPAEAPPTNPAPSAPAPTEPASAAAAPAPPPVATPAPVPAAPPTAKVQPIRPTPPAEAQDIDFQQRYGAQEQPEVAKFLGHEQPATEAPSQPKPASGATAAKSARYADAIASWAKDMGMSPKAIADQWGTTTPEVRGQIILQLKQKGYLGANETIPRTSAEGIVDALKAKAATIKPPRGFSMGEHATKH